MSKLTRPRLVFCSLVLVTAPVRAQKSAPIDAPNSCPTQITSCGCVITSTGTYEVQNDLNANQTNAPNCIEISADHAILNVKGFAVLGNGNGIGILIRRSANHAVVQGGDESSAPVENRLTGSVYQPASPQGKVFGWSVGIEDDADYSVIELFARLGGNIFQQTGNNTGLFLNGAHGSVASDFDASYNQVAGVIARNSSGLALSNFSATGSNPQGNIQPIGVWFDSTNDSTITTASMAANHVYGLWLARSSRNVVLDANGTSGNQDTGILIGCGNLHCTGNERSDDNRITNSGAPGNMMNGIVIEKKNHENIITVTHNDGNPQGHDMVDLNTHCDSNIWYNNTGTTNQDCIH
jgi:hypothetical protein